MNHEREAQDLAWDRQIWATIHAAELTSQPYTRTASGGTAYGFPAFTAAERDTLDRVHAEALRLDRMMRSRVSRVAGNDTAEVLP